MTIGAQTCLCDPGALYGDKGSSHSGAAKQQGPKQQGPKLTLLLRTEQELATDDPVDDMDHARRRVVPGAEATVNAERAVAIMNRHH
ncbi:MAG: hypothetical protein ABL994_15185 [Verrucomicrobiales bacterium]